MSNAYRDQNNVPTMIGVSSVDGVTPTRWAVDPITGRALVDVSGGTGGTVTSVSVTTANGVSGSVANPTTTPAITLTLGAITPTTVNGLTISSTTGTLSITNGKTLSALKTMSFTAADDTGVYTLPTGTKTLVATDVATLSSLTSIGTIGTGVWQGTVIGSTYGGTGVNNGGRTLTLNTNSGTLAYSAASKTLTVAKTLTLDGTDSTTMTFPSTSATIARTDAGQTFTGTQLLNENASIGLDPAGSADGKFTGITVTATAGYTQAFGDLVYLDPTDSRWEACDANSAAGADGDSRGIIGMVVVAGTDGNACTILLNGIIRADAKFPSFTVNNPIYVSETAGAVTQTQPTTTDVVIRIVGFALTADEMYFNPDNTYITHT